MRGRSGRRLPAAAEQDDEDGGRREIGRGARVREMTAVAERAIHAVDRRASLGRSDAAGRERRACLTRHVGGELGAAPARDVRVRRGGEQRQKRLDARGVPREAVAARTRAPGRR